MQYHKPGKKLSSHVCELAEGDPRTYIHHVLSRPSRVVPEPRPTKAPLRRGTFSDRPQVPFPVLLPSFSKYLLSRLKYDDESLLFSL